MGPDDLGTGLCHRVLRDKDRAAVLIGQDGGLEGADLFRDLDDLLLVKADQRAEDREGADLIGHGERRKGLRGHLPDALSGDQAQASGLLCQPLRDPHHIAAHDDRELVMRTFFVDIELDLCKIDIVQADRPCVDRDLLRKVDDLLQRPLTGIGRRIEIDGIDPDTALCDHIAGDRGIDPSGEKQHAFSAHADRKTAGSGDHMRVEVDLFPDLHIEHVFRRMDIDGQAGAGLQDRVPQFRTDLGRVHGILLVHTPGLHLKRKLPFRILLRHEGRCRFPELPDRHQLVDGDRADPPDTEDMGEGLR